LRLLNLYKPSMHNGYHYDPYFQWQEQKKFWEALLAKKKKKQKKNISKTRNNTQEKKEEQKNDEQEKNKLKPPQIKKKKPKKRKKKKKSSKPINPKPLKTEVELDAYLVKLRNLSKSGKDSTTLWKEILKTEEEEEAKEHAKVEQVVAKEKSNLTSISNLSETFLDQENVLKTNSDIFTNQRKIFKEKQMQQRMEVEKINKKKLNKGQKIYDDHTDFDVVVKWIQKNQEEAITCGCICRHAHHFMVLPTKSIEQFKSLDYDVNCFDTYLLTKLQPKGSEHFQKKGTPLLYAGEKEEIDIEYHYDAGEMSF